MMLGHCAILCTILPWEALQGRVFIKLDLIETAFLLPDATWKENTRQGCRLLFLPSQCSSTHNMNCVLRYLGSLFSW